MERSLKLSVLPALAAGLLANWPAFAAEAPKEDAKKGPLPVAKSRQSKKVDFEKHLRPLHKTKGPLYFSGVPEEGSFYDSPKYRETLKHVTGQVRDYTTGQSFISFTYGENEFLTEYYTILQNAEKLKLLKMKKSEVSALKNIA